VLRPVFNLIRLLRDRPRRGFAARAAEIRLRSKFHFGRRSAGGEWRVAGEKLSFDSRRESRREGAEAPGARAYRQLNLILRSALFTRVNNLRRARVHNRVSASLGTSLGEVVSPD